MSDSESSASIEGLVPETNEFTAEFKFPPLPKFCLQGKSASSCSDDEWNSSREDVSYHQPPQQGRRPQRRNKLPMSKLSSYQAGSSDELPPIGFFWDIENCQVPKKCSAISVVAAIREAFLPGRREAEFTVVCDARKERPALLKELNDSQVNLLHVCGIQKNAADDKLRQCMRRYVELHAGAAASPRHRKLAPALLLISGDVNFASDLSDFRYRKKMHVILLHKINTSQALIACASVNRCYTSLTADLPREEKEESPCTYFIDVDGIPPVYGRRGYHNVIQRLHRISENCGGKVIFLEPPAATLEYQSYHQAHRALKRMDGEDIFGHKIRVLPSIKTQCNGGAQTPEDDVYQTGGGGGRPLSAPPAPPPRPVSAHKQVAQYGQNPPLPMPAFPTQSHHSNHYNQGPLENGVGGNRWSHGFPDDLGSSHRNLSERTPNGYRSIRGTHGEQRHSYSRNTMHHNLMGCSFPPSHSQSPSPVPSHSPQSHNSVTPSPSPSPSPTMMDPTLWNTSERSTSDHSDGRSGSPPGSPPYVDITVTNLEHSADPTAVRNMLHRIFSVHVPVVEVSVRGTADSLAARVRVRGVGAAQLAVASLHRRRVAGRRLVLSLTPPPPATPLPLLRRQVASLLQSAPDQQLPLFRLREMFALRHGRALPTAEVSRLRDTCALVDSPRGRSVKLLRVPPPNPNDHQWWGESGVCALHGGEESTEGSSGGVGILPIFVDLSIFSQRVHSMLSEHGGVLLVNSLPQCYQAQFGEPLVIDPVGGVALEHVISCVNGLALRAQPPPHSRKLVVLAPPTAAPPPVPADAVSSGFGSASTDEEVPGSLASLRALLARELLDLLRKAPRCQMPFTRLIPSYHLHFGKQCRVADYGFTKLADLLDSLSHTIQVMGEGLGRVITLSHSAQIRRFTLDLLKVLRAQPDKSLMLQQLPELYRRTLGREFDSVEYGACRAEDLVGGVAKNCLALGPEEGRISLPRHRQTPKEESRIRQFALQAIELLRHAPNCRLELSKFVPAYHTHFGRQLRVAYYGLPKVQDLFYAIPDTIEMWTNEEGERVVGLHFEAARKVVGPQIAALPLPVSLASLPDAYFSVHGGELLPEAYGCPDLISLLRCLPNIQLIEGFGEGGAIIAPADTSIPRASQHAPCHTKEMANEAVNNIEASTGWGAAGLVAYRVLVSDLCVSNGGSRIEHFCREFRVLSGQDPPLNILTRNNCIKIANDRVVLTLLWRCIGRMVAVARQADRPLSPTSLALAYQQQYQHQLPVEALGFDSVNSLIAHCGEIWEWQNGLVQVKSSLTSTLSPEPKPHVELLPTTPPGQKSSSVWNTPPAIPRGPWKTPPTSPAPCMLPLPAAHLFSNTKRKVRLAAQFNSPA